MMAQEPANNGVSEIPSGEIESNCDEVFESFDNMNLRTELLRGIFGYG